MKQKELDKIVKEKEARRQKLKKLEPTWTQLQTLQREIKDLDETVHEYTRQKEEKLTEIDKVCKHVREHSMLIIGLMLSL